jgi:hypothetical protein
LRSPPALAVSARVGHLCKVGREGLQRPWIEIGHKVEIPGSFTENLLHGGGAVFGGLTGQTQLMLAKKPPEPLMVDRLTGPLLKLR